MELGVIIISSVLLLVSWWYIRRNKFMKHMGIFPGPPPLPIVGNALDLASPTDVMTKFLEYNKQYGGIVKVHIGPTPTLLLITDYKLLEYILSSTTILNKAEQYQYFSKWLGNGLITATGDDRWKKHRKIITPTFHFKILEQFIDIFESASKILIKKLSKKVESPSVNIHPLISLCTLDIICESAMGTSVNAQENSESEYVRSVREMCRIIVQRTFNPLLQHRILYYFSEQYRTEKKCIQTIHTYADSVISSRKADLKNKQNISTPDNELGIKKRLAFLDVLLEENAMNQSLSDEDIRDEVNNFMFAVSLLASFSDNEQIKCLGLNTFNDNIMNVIVIELLEFVGFSFVKHRIVLRIMKPSKHFQRFRNKGHDTTASAISFALYCLAENPDVQEKVVEELQEIFEEPSQSVTIRDLQEMKYLESVIKEVLRLYPPAPFYSRHTHKDIEYDGRILPKGITLVINAFGIHRNPEIYPEPEKFIPERFTSENSADRLPYSYIPFSAGSRNCIGQKYAMLEMKTVLSTLLRHYKVLPATPKHTVVLSNDLVLLSSSGICISVKERIFY